MIPIEVVSIHEAHPEMFGRRMLAEVTRLTHYAMGLKWATDLLPEHFEHGAHTIFGYQERNWEYVAKKLAFAPREYEDTDLTWSGRMKRDLLRAKHMVRAFPTRVTITLLGPEYFTDRPRRPGHPNMAREVKAMSPRHERILSETADRAFDRAMRMARASRRARKTTRIGGRAAA